MANLTKRDLVVRIRDNGTGIPIQIVMEGKPGHFGLAGMRERAQRIMAELQISSDPDLGTTIKLQVQGPVVFIPEASKHRRS